MLQSMGLQRVGHDWATELILVAYFQFHSQQSHFKPNVSKLNRSLNIQQKYPQWGSPHGMQYEKDTESDSGNHKALLSIIKLFCPSDWHIPYLEGWFPTAIFQLDGLDNIQHCQLGNKYTFRRLTIQSLKTLTALCVSACDPFLLLVLKYTYKLWEF